MSTINPYASPQESASQTGPGGRQPGVVPRSLGGVLAAGTALYVNHFPTWATLTLIFWTPLELASSYYYYFVLDAEDFGSAFQMAVIVEGLFGIIVIGGVIQLADRAWRGEPIAWWRGLAEGLAAWPRLFSTRLIGGIVTALGLVALVLPGLYVAVRIALSDSVSVLEHKTGMRALPRSMDLSYRRFFHFLVLNMVTYGPLVAFSLFHQMPLVYWAQLDHWLTSTALSLLVDLAEPWVVLVFFAAYLSEVAAEKEQTEAEASAPANAASEENPS